MGIYDRDYYRTERPSLGFRPPTRMVGILIGINVAVLILDFLLTPDRPRGHSPTTLQNALGVHSDTIFRPWLWYQFLGYGFVHASQLFHLLGNMFMLWVFGGDLEDRYGPREFLRFYLSCIVFGGVVWGAIDAMQGRPQMGLMYGASGGVAGLVVLYALNFPRNTILLMFVIPMRAWLFGALFVLLDMFGYTGGLGQTNVAYSVHLAGAAFALLYFQLRWNFGSLVRWDLSWLRQSFRRGPRLRVLRPDADDEQDEASLNEDEVDRILAKLHREGERSLTARERKTLQEASREYQRKRHTGADD